MLSYLSLSLGIIAASQMQIIPLISWLLIIAAIIVFFRLRKIYLNRGYYWLFCATLIVAGLAYGELRQHFRDQQLLTAPLSNIMLEGYLTSPPDSTGNWVHSEFKITSGSFAGHKIMLYYPPETPLSAGYRYRFAASLKPLNSAGNFAANNYSDFLINNSISASAFIVGKPQQLARDYSPAAVLNYYRSNLIDYLSATLKPYQYGGLAIALISGYQKLIPPEQWQVYKNSGIVHIISISGLHITLVTTLVVMLLGLILKFMPPLTIPKQILLLWGGIIFAFLYSLIAGFSIPCQRTFYLILIMGYLTTRRIHLPLLQKLAMTLALVLVIDPFSVQSIGFWFSFILVATIFSFQTLHKKQLGKIRLWIYLQITMALVSLPLSLFFFSYYPLTSILGNLWAVPLLGNLITPLLLLAGISHWSWLLIITTKLTAYIIVPLNYLAQIPPYWQTAPNLASVLLAFAGLGLLIIPKLFHFQRSCGLIFIGLLLLPQPQLSPLYRQTRLIVFSNDKVGYSLLQTAQNNLLLITTNQPEQIDKQFTYSALPYLQREHITRIDYLLSNYPAESDLANHLQREQIKIVHKNLPPEITLDGVRFHYWQSQANHWLSYEDANGANYIGDGSQPDFTTMPDFATVAINFPLAKANWLYIIAGNNLLLNYPSAQSHYWQGLSDNINLSFKHIYDLATTGSVMIFESQIITVEKAQGLS